MKDKSKNILELASQYNEGSFGDIIVRNALYYPVREAFVHRDQRVTFKQYDRRVNSLIHALLDMGTKKGDVLGVLSWNCIDYMDVFGAAEKAGFIISPFSPRFSSNELEYVINDSDSNTLFVGPELADVCGSLRSRLPRVKNYIGFESGIPGMELHARLLKSYPGHESTLKATDEDSLFICYTSGTTGRPRGAWYTQGRFREAVIGHSLDIPISIHTRTAGLMPLFHIGGIMSRAHIFYNGGTNVLMKFFDPSELMATIEREKLTHISVVPTHLGMILDLPDFRKYDVSSIKRVGYAASPMPVDLLKRGMQAFGHVFSQGYGQTEAGPDISRLKEEDHEVLDQPAEMQKRLLSCGHPVLGVHVRVVDEMAEDVQPGEVGEIIVKSRHIMNGYWNKPEETQKKIVNGWLHTGDMGRYDEDGYIYIVDRKEDMIISGGENIYPREVEEVLHEHPGVLECAVFGVPDPKWVEAVHGVVALKRGQSATAEELIEFCKAKMARHKAPKSIEIVTELPKNAAGKILKRVLKQENASKR